MKYNFDQITNRLKTNSYKWDVEKGELPMWVADMDFKVFPKIKEALIEAVNVEGYGYSFPTEKFFLAYQAWWQRRHNLFIDTKEMIYVSGVVSALDSLIRTLTKENDGVLLFSPCYNVFYNVVKNNNRKLVVTDLIYQNEEFVIDYDDFEKKVIEENVKALIFCNPQNPTGKIWSKEEIKRVSEICHKHHVVFISDEIHCDIVDPGYHYVPALLVDEDVITCIAPSKVFNIAGLQSAVTVIKNESIRQKVQEAFYHDDIGEPNFFVEPATVAAYTYGDDWVDELNSYLFENKRYVTQYLKENIPHLKAVSGHATYLLWLDISCCQMKSDEFVNTLRKETGLFIHPGSIYGSNGVNYVRINIATSLENVKDAMNRLEKFFKNKEKTNA